MANGNKEIELQLKIANKKSLILFLTSNAQKISTSKMVDDYFIPPHKNYLSEKPVSEWLRLRASNGVHSITYKKCHFAENEKDAYRDEYESKVENIDSLYRIFDALNFKKIVTVDKRRIVYHYKNDYEFAIDSVKGLGDFVEVEYIGNNADMKPKEFFEQVIKLLKGINVGKIEINYVGYPALILFPNEAAFKEL
jgi:adenylate cyclase class 2